MDGHDLADLGTVLSCYSDPSILKFVEGCVFGRLLGETEGYTRDLDIC